MAELAQAVAAQALEALAMAEVEEAPSSLVEDPLETNLVRQKKSAGRHHLDPYMHCR